MDHDVPLAPHTTFGIGGPARYFVRVRTTEELHAALAFAQAKELGVFIMGGGSNVLVSDKGFGGLAIKIELTGIERDGDALIAGGGDTWDELVLHAVEEHLWGIENLAGIPGTVGGAVAGSIGAYGQSLSQTLAWAETLELSTGEIKKISNAECRFGYRESLFSRGGFVIVRAAFALSRSGAPATSYVPELAGLSLTEVRRRILEIRAAKFPDLAQEGTAGSFFKNPLLPPAEAAALKARYPAMPLYPMPESTGLKIPLAWILDKALGLKGYRVGGARLYEHQPLVIVARPRTPARDVESLARFVEEKIKKEIGIDIEREVKVIHTE
jgi:UDP-N-acetylmuramate dehydrogenase